VQLSSLAQDGPTELLFEPVDIKFLRSLLSMQLVHRVAVSVKKKATPEEDHIDASSEDAKPSEPLATVIYKVILRAEAFNGCIPVLSHGSKLDLESGVGPLRSYSGAKTADEWKNLDEAVRAKLDRLVEKGMSPYDSTRSGFSYPSKVKQLLRFIKPIHIAPTRRTKRIGARLLRCFIE
jgi:hypothetical protein